MTKRYGLVVSLLVAWLCMVAGLMFWWPLISYSWHWWFPQ